jgi:glycosyltransferase involved in cell wall biosynthesis
MNICLISKEYPPETGWGGIGTYTYNLAHGLTELGHEVHVIAQAVEVARDYMDGMVHVHRINPKNIQSPYLNRVLHSLIYSFQVSEKIKSIDCEFDIVEAPEWGAEGFVQSFSKRLPLITRLHTPLFLIKRLYNQKMDNSAKIINFLEKTQTKNICGITSPTVALAKKVSKHWNIDLARITVIPNGIDIEKIISIEIKQNSMDSDYLLYIGRLEQRKGVHILAKALPGVFERNPNLKMVFIGKDMTYGSGTMKEFILDVNREYQENLIFTGFVPDDEKYSLIKYSKFVVLPSLWENFPYTCLESMALGKAIIATKGSGYNEIIEDGQSGFLVEAENSFALQNKIIECLDSEGKILQAEQRIEKKVKDFDIRKISIQMCRYYEQILNNNYIE